MTATSNLGITPIASNQAQKEITANDAVERLAGALADHLDVVMADADVTLTAAEALAHVSFKCTGALTAGRNLVVPTNTKLYSVLNATTGGYAVTVKTASGTGVAVVASTEAIVRCDGTNVVAVAAAGGGSIVSSVFGRSGAVTAQSGDYTAAQVTNAVATSRQVATGTGLSGGGDLSADRTLSLANTAVSAGSYTKASITVDAQGRLTAASSAAAEPYDIASFYPGVPGNSQVLLRFVAPRAISLPSGLTGSYGSAGTASTGTANIDVTKNGSSIGTVVFTASASATFTFASPQSLAAGDVLKLIGPSSADATLADIAITLAGTR